MTPFSSAQFEHVARPLHRALTDIAQRLRKKRHCLVYLDVASHFLTKAERKFHEGGDPMDPGDAAVFQVLRDLSDAIDRLRIALATGRAVEPEDGNA